MSKKILGLLLKNIYNFGCFRETLYCRFGIPEVRRTTRDNHSVYCWSRVLHIVRQSEVSFVDELKHVVMRRRSWSCVSENDKNVKNRGKKYFAIRVGIRPQTDIVDTACHSVTVTRTYVLCAHGYPFTCELPVRSCVIRPRSWLRYRVPCPVQNPVAPMAKTQSKMQRAAGEGVRGRDNRSRFEFPTYV